MSRDADVVTLKHSALNESSGLTFSVADADCVWTHNDSGDGARLYGFDHRTGRLTGTCTLEGAEAIDWEDMTMVRRVAEDEGEGEGEGPAPVQIVIADSGDNGASRPHVTLYVFDEPDPHQQTTLSRSQWQAIDVVYPDGPMDCEAVWYDAPRDAVMMLGKSAIPWVGLYEVAWPQVTAHLDGDRQSGGAQSAEESKRRPLQARYVTSLALPMATSADRDPATGEVWVVSYWHAWRFPAASFRPGQVRLSPVPDVFEVPAWRQIEAVAVDGRSRVWVSSEGADAPLAPLNRTPAQLAP